MTEYHTVSGWCLRENKFIEFIYPKDVICLVACPYCGPITERLDQSFHVFNPSKPLLKILQRFKELK